MCLHGGVLTKYNLKKFIFVPAILIPRGEDTVNFKFSYISFVQQILIKKLIYPGTQLGLQDRIVNKKQNKKKCHSLCRVHISMEKGRQ